MKTVSFFLIFSVLFVGLQAFAANRRIEIDSKLFFQGKKIGAPRIMATEGKKAKVIMNDQKQNREYNLEVFPVVKNGNQIDLQYSLSIRENNNETLTRGRVTIPNQKRAQISLDRGRIQMDLKVSQDAG